jgi:hypothetical protein
MEIEIHVGRRWRGEGEEEQLAKRIARIVAYDDTACELKKDGYKWALDYRGNDWWMSGIENGVVKAKRAAIAKAEKPSYKTNCSFSYIEGNKSSATNIHVETDVKKLILMVAFLSERQVSYHNAAKLLGVENPPDFKFTWDNFTADEWIGDIKARIAKIQISAEKEKLENLEKRLNKIVSPEKRAELELEAIEQELK